MGNEIDYFEAAGHNGKAFATVGKAIAMIGEILVTNSGTLTPESIAGLTKVAFQLAEGLPDCADMEV